jgi:hypothetical protein
MRATWTFGEDRTTARLDWVLDAGEGVTGTGQGFEIGMLTDRCHFRFDRPITVPGGDLLALAAFTVLQPWVGSRFEVDVPVSAEFAEELEEAFGVRVGPVDGTSTRRDPPHRIALSYSGGVDSMAAAEVLPAGTPLVHFERVPHPQIPNRATHIRSDVVASLVRTAGDRGREVQVVGSDLEYVCSPYPTLPQWVTIGVGSILLADELGCGYLSFGAVLGSRYLANGYRYRPGPAADAWSKAFAGAGMPFMRPSCGMTEVATLRLATMGDLGDLARSCLLGGPAGPCLNCKKCLRRELIAAGIEERSLDSRLLENLDDQRPEVSAYREKPPYYFQHVVEFGLARAEGIDDIFLADAKRWLAPTRESTGWTTRYYRPAIDDNVPPEWRDETVAAVERVLRWMTAEEEAVVETWDAEARIKT